jgi:hypothetical protein
MTTKEHIKEFICSQGPVTPYQIIFYLKMQDSEYSDSYIYNCKCSEILNELISNKEIEIYSFFTDGEISFSISDNWENLNSTKTDNEEHLLFALVEVCNALTDIQQFIGKIFNFTESPVKQTKEKPNA